MRFDTQILKDFEHFVEKRSFVNTTANPAPAQAGSSGEQSSVPQQAPQQQGNAVVKTQETNSLQASPLIAAHANSQPITNTRAPLKELKFDQVSPAAGKKLTKTLT